MGEIQVRAVRPQDKEVIIRIDALCTGARKEGLWRGLVGAYADDDPEAPGVLSPELLQVAELDGNVVGFMMGDILSWQFGIERAGRIIAIGIHPDHRRRGVATRLVKALLDVFRRLELSHVQCLAVPGDGLDAFFRANGFVDSSYRVLDHEL